MRNRTAHIARRLVLAKPLIDDLPQQIVGPGQKLHLGDELGAHPVHAASTSGEPKRLPRGGGFVFGLLVGVNERDGSTVFARSRTAAASSSLTGDAKVS